MHISAEIEMGIEREADGTGDGVTSEMDVDGDFFCSSLLPSLSYNLLYNDTVEKRDDSIHLRPRYRIKT